MDNTAKPAISKMNYFQKISKKPLSQRIYENRWIYAFIFPGLVFLIIFCYTPMYGITLAFKEYEMSKGILGSGWINPWYSNFIQLTGDSHFWGAFFNTFRMGFFYIITGFPAPIILAILLNEVAYTRFKKTLQVIYTFPNFLSWVIVGGLMTSMLATDGLINSIIELLGGEAFEFLTSEKLIRPMLYSTSVWKGAGWASIIYLAGIASINPELYEAARIDGANRFHIIRYIIWPEIKTTASILLIMSFGGIMGQGFDQILNMVNPVVKDAAEVLDTYIYRKTFQSTPNYGVSTAMGLSKSVINFVFLLAANKISKLLGSRGIM